MSAAGGPPITQPASDRRPGAGLLAGGSLEWSEPASIR